MQDEPTASRQEKQTEMTVVLVHIEHLLSTGLKATKRASEGGATLGGQE